MRNPDPFFRKVWLNALERSIAEGVISPDHLLKVKENKESYMEEFPDSHGSSSTLVDYSTGDSDEPSSTDSPLEGDNIFAGMAGNEKFQRWKAELINKRSMQSAPVTKEGPDTGTRALGLKSNTVSLPDTNPTSGTVKVAGKGIASHPAINPQTGGGKQLPANSGNPVLSYIRSREKNPMFSSSRTPARHSSQVRGPVRWMRVNLGNYSTFDLADNKFENAGKPRPWDPEKKTWNSF